MIPPVTIRSYWAAAATLLLAISAVALFACSDEGDPVDTGCTSFPCEEPWYPDDYMSNASWSEVITCRFSGPHGPGMRVHISPSSQAALYLDRDGRVAGFALGTTIVKTEYTSPACDSSPARITVMRKAAAGTAPTSGNWEWQEFRFDDKIEREGQLTDCLSCHTGAANTECGPAWDYTCVIP